MKSLNDLLRDEFKKVLEDPEINAIIHERKLDPTKINDFFNQLLRINLVSMNAEDIDTLKSQFEVYIINKIKGL